MSEQTSTPENKVSNGPSEQSTSQKYVPVELATDAELDSFLENQSDAGEEDSDSPSEVQEPEADDSDAEGSDEGEGEESESEDSEKVTLTKSELKALTKSAERSEENEKQVKHQKAFIASRNQEIGELRKSLKEAKERLGEGLDDLPQSQAIEQADKIKEINSELDGLDQEEALNNHVLRVHEAVSKHVDFKTFGPEDVADVLLNDGVDKSYIAQFLANPYPQFSSEGEAVQLYKRAAERRLMKKLVGFIKKIRSENVKLKSKPERIMNKVTKLLDAPSKLNGGSGTSTGRRKVSERDIELMDDAELDALLENE